MKSISVDLETYDNKSTSVILSIGAVFFNEETGDIGDVFYRVISREGQVELGLTESQDTIDWWSQQSEEARRVFTENGVLLKDALAEFSDWILSHVNANQVKPWGNGADFDNAILQHAYHKVGLECPWKFWNNRCYRTIRGIAKAQGFIEGPRQGTYHNALDDAIHQCKTLQQMYRFLDLSHD